MKNKIMFLILFISLTSMIYALDSVAFALKVKGNVELAREENVSEISTGEELINKDELESKEDSFAAIKFIDGSSIVKLFPNSILQINTEKVDGKLNKKSFLKMGNLWSKVVQKTGVFEVETPTTVVSVKGTEFLLTVSEMGITEIFTFTGEVQVRNKFDNKTSTVPAGNKALSTGETELEITEIEEGDIDEETQEYIEEEVEEEEEEQIEPPKVLEIHLQHPSGETKIIRIEYE